MAPAKSPWSHKLAAVLACASGRPGPVGGDASQRRTWYRFAKSSVQSGTFAKSVRGRLADPWMKGELMVSSLRDKSTQAEGLTHHLPPTLTCSITASW